MKNVWLAGSFFLCITSVISAQDIVPAIEYVESRKVLEKGIEYFEKGDYQRALDQFNKVSPSDTAYSTALYEKALTFNMMERNTDALAAIAELETMRSDLGAQLYTLKANCFDDMDRKEEALAAYDEGIVKYPDYHSLHFNKAITLIRLKRYDEAETSLLTSIRLSPGHGNSHLILSYLNVQKKRYVPALMSGLVALLISDDAGRNNNCIRDLERMMRLEDVFDQAYVQTAADKELVASFGDLEEVISSGLALNKAFKFKLDPDLAMIRQMQVLMDGLKADPNRKDIYHQYYGPLLLELKNKKYTQLLAYWVLRSLDDNYIRAKVNGNIKKLSKMFPVVVGFVDNNFYMRDIVVDGKPLKVKTAYYNDLSLASVIECKDPACKTWGGYFATYYANGNIKEVGRRNGDIYDGNIVNYHKDGTLEAEGFYASGMVNGLFRLYYDNGLLSVEATMKDSKVNGLLKRYYYTGMISEEKEQKMSVEEGITREYHENGLLATEGTIKNGKLTGLYKYNNADGSLYYQVNMLNGEVDGEYISYYNGMLVYEKGRYKAGKKVGDWVTFYPNGAVRKREFYDENGLKKGKWESFTPTGILTDEEQFGEGGKKNGKSSTYDSDGKLHFTYEFKDAVITSFVTYDKAGNKLYESTANKGTIQISYFSPLGLKVYDGQFTNGIKEGDWVYYHGNGNVQQKVRYKNGLEEGPMERYFVDGKLDYKGTYKNGKIEGYYLSYYRNGKVYCHGWYKDGLQTGKWLYYYPDGKISKETWFLNDRVHGRTDHYSFNGYKSRSEFYQHGYLTGIAMYNKDGEKYHEQMLSANSTGILELKAPNGVVYSTQKYVGGMRQDTTYYTHAGNKPSVVVAFSNGQRNGTHTSYHENGVISYTDVLLQGRSEGYVTWYDYKGVKTDEEYKVYGQTEGTSYQYHYTGSVFRKRECLENQLHGYSEWYAPDGSVMFRILFENDIPRAYTYKARDGKWVADIPITGKEDHIVAYYENGKKSVDYSYVNHRLQGKYLLYYPDGKVMEDKTYNLGHLEGEALHYYANGKLRIKREYFYGEEHGKTIYYAENGTPEREYSSVYGNLEGPAVYYDKNGKILKYLEFFDDTIVIERIAK